LNATYTSWPFGEIAIHGLSLKEMPLPLSAIGVDHVAPWSVDFVKDTPGL